MRVDILGSGSRGNALVVDGGDGGVMVDCGFGTRTLATRLKSLGAKPESVVALLVTHEHSDHVSGAARAAKKWGWKVGATAGTIAAARRLAEVSPHAVTTTRRLRLAGLTVEFLSIAHDAREPVAMVVTHQRSGARLGIVYDLGHWTPALARRLEKLDALILESNHDERMLLSGPYPAFLKERIRGPNGHLSNAESARLVAAVAHPGLRTLVLAHLSEENNTPDVALRSVRAVARKAGFTGSLHAAAQDTVFTFEVGVGPSARQLALSL